MFWHILFSIIVIFLFSLLDYYIIETYSKDTSTLTKKQKLAKDHWHTVQFILVSVIFFLINKRHIDRILLIDYLLYYSFFEVSLNLLRGLRPFYISIEDNNLDGIPDGGGWTDRLRYKWFGKHVEQWEGSFKFLAIVTIISILFSL